MTDANLRHKDDINAANRTETVAIALHKQLLKI